MNPYLPGQNPGTGSEGVSLETGFTDGGRQSLESPFLLWVLHPGRWAPAGAFPALGEHFTLRSSEPGDRLVAPPRLPLVGGPRETGAGARGSCSVGTVTASQHLVLLAQAPCQWSFLHGGCWGQEACGLGPEEGLGHQPFLAPEFLISINIYFLPPLPGSQHRAASGRLN